MLEILVAVSTLLTQTCLTQTYTQVGERRISASLQVEHFEGDVSCAELLPTLVSGDCGAVVVDPDTSGDGAVRGPEFVAFAECVGQLSAE